MHTASSLSCPPRKLRLLRIITGALFGLAGCHSFHLEPLGLDKTGKTGKEAAPAAAPAQKQFRISQYVFLADFDVKQDQALFRDLASLRDQVYKELQLAGSDTFVQVYLFEKRETYDRFMQAKYPDLPKRRAFFVAQPQVGAPEDLLVYTYWGDRIEEDLRHELTHALLHSVLKEVPLWLDEGLAEYFEVPMEWKGINYRHLAQFRQGPAGAYKPDLERLEQLNQVQQMSPAEYREAWAWVHFILNDKAETKTVLTNYLQQLRTNPNPGTLAPRLAGIYPSLTAALTQHLSQIQAANGPLQAQAIKPIQ
jgi:hypothetical protein